MRIFITRKIPGPAIALLKKKYTVRVYPKNHIISRQELLRGVRGAHAILPMLTEKIDKEVFSAAGSQLKIIANYAVGFDNIDLTEAARRHIFVTNAPGPEIVEAVAEHTIALMFSLAKRLIEADRFARAGKYQGWEPELFLDTKISGKTLGIVGLGRIGFAVAERAARGMGMQVIYNDVKPNADFEKQYGAKFGTLDFVLKKSDFVSLHVPLLPATHHLISDAQFKKMKKTAFLINTARGPVVDEHALLIVLSKKQIAGAALDVFECEPSTDCDVNDHLELKKFPNVILTPHTASATFEARAETGMVAAKNIVAALEGKTPPNMVK